MTGRFPVALKGMFAPFLLALYISNKPRMILFFRFWELCLLVVMNDCLLFTATFDGLLPDSGIAWGRESAYAVWPRSRAVRNLRACVRC